MHASLNAGSLANRRIMAAVVSESALRNSSGGIMASRCRLHVFASLSNTNSKIEAPMSMLAIHITFEAMLPRARLDFVENPLRPGPGYGLECLERPNFLITASMFAGLSFSMLALRIWKLFCPIGDMVAAVRVVHPGLAADPFMLRITQDEGFTDDHDRASYKGTKYRGANQNAGFFLPNRVHKIGST